MRNYCLGVSAFSFHPREERASPGKVPTEWGDGVLAGSWLLFHVSGPEQAPGTAPSNPTQVAALERRHACQGLLRVLILRAVDDQP